jgi:uncharacterized membrane protein YkvA (DUF1232 family)
MSELSEEKVKKQYEKSQKKFTEEEVHKVLDKAEELKSKFQNKSRLSQYWEDFKLLFSMIKDYYNKKYTTVPWYVISAIGGTLLYVLSPIDLIPDFIPFIGYIDDSAVFAFCLNRVSAEVAKYKEWKKSNS